MHFIDHSDDDHSDSELLKRCSNICGLVCFWRQNLCRSRLQRLRQVELLWFVANYCSRPRNCKVYLSKLQTVFAQIAKDICPNSFVFKGFQVLLLWFVINNCSRPSIFANTHFFQNTIVLTTSHTSPTISTPCSDHSSYMNKTTHLIEGITITFTKTSGRKP